MATRPTAPVRLSIADYEALEPADQARHDGQRLDWLSSGYVLAVPDTVHIQRLAAMTAVEASSSAFVGATGLAISGTPTLGKTTAMLLAGREHETRRRRQTGLGDDPAYAPVLYVVTPPGATPKALLVAFCNVLGIVARPRSTAQELTEIVIERLRQLHTTMILLDEIHNLTSSRISGAEAATTLKLFAERINGAFIYAGVNLHSSGLFTGDIGAQLKGRIAMYEMRGYAYHNETQRTAWDSLVLALEDYMPLLRQEPNDLVAMAPYLYARTGGSIGSLRTLLRRGAILAMSDHTERLTQELLDSIPTDQQAQGTYDRHLRSAQAG